VWTEAGTNLSAAEQGRAWTAWTTFVQLTNHIPDLKQPKRHMTAHLLHNSGRLGSPLNYANWLDESLNKTLKLSCRLTSQATFERMVLLRMKSLLKGGLKRPRP
jgi:hypothetical protein